MKLNNLVIYVRNNRISKVATNVPPKYIERCTSQMCLPQLSFSTS